MTASWHGSCGVEFCADCLPIYDADNNPIGDVPPVVIPTAGGEDRG